MAPKRWISIRNIIIYLETKFRPNRRIFVFWRPFLAQNGHHSKPKWSPYGEVCLTPCKYPFLLKSVHFWIFNDFFNFYIGGHFENFKNRAQLWVIIYFCVKFQKDPLYGLNLTFFAPWLPWQRLPFWIFPTPPPPNSYKVSWSLMKGIKFFFNPPFFVSMATAAKFVQPIPFFWAYLVPLAVDVVPIKFHQFLFGE